MTSMASANPNTSMEKISEFEQIYDVKLPKEYVEFLLKFNGGYPQKSSFKISENEGESLVNKFYGLGEIESSLAKVFEVLEDEIPENFISIANDPAGNEILLGVSGKELGQVYFWIHDRDIDEEMENMIILENSFTEFFNKLY